MSHKKTNVADMNYRQWLIGMAMQGLLASDAEGSMTAENCASDSIRYADALLNAMESENPKTRASEIL
ncbi:hypothetical protein ACMGEE_01305 [Erwinia sp. DT-104]|uniref:hypothetical protein n=1 Tax=Erwinia sp. DT-104 TaxID=3396161 RepID=UPI003F1C2F5D